MDRSLEAALAELAQRLMTRSKKFESVAQQCDPLEALKQMGTLEEVTRKSLLLEQPEPAPVRAQAPITPAVPVSYSTSHQEYRAALEDGSIIEALLKFHEQTGTQPVTAKSQPPVPEAALPPEQTSIAAPEPFEAISPPMIAAKPKPSPFLKRPPGVCQTILR